MESGASDFSSHRQSGAQFVPKRITRQIEQLELQLEELETGEAQDIAKVAAEGRPEPIRPCMKLKRTHRETIEEANPTFGDRGDRIRSRCKPALGTLCAEYLSGL